MYGSIFRMRVKPDSEQKLIDLMEEWERDIRPNVEGVRAGYVLKPDNARNELIGVAVFADQDSYRANAASPEQDAWYRKIRELLESDPEWQDGEFISDWT